MILETVENQKHNHGLDIATSGRETGIALSIYCQSKGPQLHTRSQPVLKANVSLPRVRLLLSPCYSQSSDILVLGCPLVGSSVWLPPLCNTT